MSTSPPSIRSITILFVLTFSVLLISPYVVAENDPNVVRAYHIPTEPFGGETVSVYAELKDLTNVSMVQTQYCEIDPETLQPGTCYYLVMDNLGNKTFLTNITKSFSGGTMIGYRIIVGYDENLPGYYPEHEYIYYNYTGGARIPPPSTEIPQDVIIVESILGLIIAGLIVFLIYRRVRKIEVKSSQTIVLGLIALVMVALLYGAIGMSSVGNQVTKVENFSLNDIYGTPWNLSDHAGKVVILDFMAISCTGCEELRQSLVLAVDDFTEDEIEIISISVADNDYALRQYKIDYGVQWTIARDTANLIDRFGVSGLPKLIIINKDGYATFETTDAHTSSSKLRGEIRSALEGTARPISIAQIGIFATGAFMGIATYFSPCSFPMLPGYISFYLSTELEKKKSLRTVVASGLISGLGIILVFLIIGLLALWLGEAANIGAYVIYLGPIVGIILIILGALMFTNIQYHGLVRPFQVLRSKIFGQRHAGTDASGYYAKLFSYGVGYGAAASACTAPLFIGLLLAALVAGSFTDGLIMILIFSSTILLLMITITLLLSTVGQESVQKMAAHTESIKKISGLVLIVAGAYLLFYYWTTFS